MTIDEAIKHCEEIAMSKCDMCGVEHRQLAEWLQELKERRCGMNLGVFWQRIETAIDCDICPVQEYAKETNTERMCDKVCDCADGLMMLHRKLQEEERQKMDREREE